MDYLIAFIIFLYGSILTSFYILVGMRLPMKKTLLGRSECDACGAVIPWFGLVPILGYFLVRGQCATCETKVSIKYPAYELVGGLLFALSYWLMRDNMVEYAIVSIMLSLMIIVTVSDLEHRIVPDRVLLVFLPILLVLRVLFPLTNWVAVVLGGVLGFGIMYLLAIYGQKRFKQEALGGGDIKLYLLIGLFLEVQLVFLSLFFASIFGLLIGQFLKKKMTHVPFVPFIFVGVILAYLYGPALMQWYLGLF